MRVYRMSGPFIFRYDNPYEFRFIGTADAMSNATNPRYDLQHALAETAAAAPSARGGATGGALVQ